MGLIKDELGGKLIVKFAALDQKKYSYLTDNDCSERKLKEQDYKEQECVIKSIRQFKRLSIHYKDCLFNNKPILQSQQRLKNEAHNIDTEEINKIALRPNHALKLCRIKLK